MAAGTPVIAYRGGGYLESIVEGKTGIFFEEDLVSAIKKFEKRTFQPGDCIAQAKKFSKARFQQKLKKFVKEKYYANS